MEAHVFIICSVPVYKMGKGSEKVLLIKTLQQCVMLIRTLDISSRSCCMFLSWKKGGPTPNGHAVMLSHSTPQVRSTA